MYLPSSSNQRAILSASAFCKSSFDSDFAQLISTIQVEAVIGMNIRRLGDSDTYVLITPTYSTGEQGLNEIKDVAKNIAEFAREAIPAMTKDYAAFYQHFLDDFEKNGLTMPMAGKIL